MPPYHAKNLEIFEEKCIYVHCMLWWFFRLLSTFVGSWLINVKEWKLKWSVKILNISELIKDAVNWYTDREISRNLICWEATQFAFCQLHGRSSAWKFQDTNLTGLQNAEPQVFKSTTLFPLISNIVKMCQGQVSFLKKCLS